ncbi:MAG: hypothetical protein Q8R13_02020 [bacterium]|nr:hypothetical protein [bacterium]MDZ4295951.1 hypothetical protein [Patescibacteria group bacterium]
MHNWSVDIEALKKDPEQYAIWRLEQLINFGTDGEQISEAQLRRFWDRLTLDPERRRFIGFLLWGERFLAKGN